MKLGKFAPRSTRPDFNVGSTWNTALPRRMKLRITSGSGTYPVAWDELVSLSTIFAVDDDGQSVRYDFHHDDRPGEYFRLIWKWRYFPSEAAPTQQFPIAWWEFYDGVDLVAHFDDNSPRTSQEWWSPYPATFYSLPTGNWTCPAGPSIFGVCNGIYGSADWASQPDYRPYVTRP